MFGLFKKEEDEHAGDGSAILGELPIPDIPFIDFSAFPTGIDNLRIDVTLSAGFVKITREAVREIFLEFGTTNKRVREKPSPKIQGLLSAFTNTYTSLLETATHRAKEGRRQDRLQLFQVSVVHFITVTLQESWDDLLSRLRADALHSPHGSQRAVELHERAARLGRQRATLVSHAAQLLFRRLQWAENSPAATLRESLLGIRWPVAECMLFNPLLIYQDRIEEEVQMREYVILHQDSRHPYSIAKLDELMEALLEYIAAFNRLREEESARALIPEEFRFSWKESPACMDRLFDTETTRRELSWLHDDSEKKSLQARLDLQEKARTMLIKGLRRARLITFISAAYHTPGLYPDFAYALKPYMVFRMLCGEMALELAVQKVELQQKLRKKPRSGDTWGAINLLAKTKKDVARAVQTDEEELCIRFLKDFIRYRRDLKALSQLQDATKRLHLLFDEQEIRLSKSNGMLQAFLQQDEYTEDGGGIRGHVMLKADIRGSTVIVDELKKRGLNPATHFSLNFFQPINRLMAQYGAEKVFIEGDAVILTIFECLSAPEHWLAVARACGLGVSVLQVVEEQNRVCQENGLPLLEIGIGICHAEEAPTFLYDGDHRIMISDAIGKADRLSSCSWALRRKFAEQRLLTKVLVFEQPSGQFKGEKGVTTLRFNLNGIELDNPAFHKLCSETTLQPLNITLDSAPDTVRFYAGNYPDLQGNMQQLLIREGRVRLWQTKGEDYPPTDAVYYEVMNPRALKLP